MKKKAKTPTVNFQLNSLASFDCDIIIISNNRSVGRQKVKSDESRSSCSRKTCKIEKKWEKKKWLFLVVLLTKCQAQRPPNDSAHSIQSFCTLISIVRVEPHSKCQ